MKFGSHWPKNAECSTKEKENKEPPGSSKQTQNASCSSGSAVSEIRNETTLSSKQNHSPPTPGTMNKEMISILREMNVNMNKQGDKLESLSERVDSLYEGYDYEYYDCEEDVTVENSDIGNTDFDSEAQSHESVSEILEPAPKKPKTLTFKDLSDKYHTTDKVDAEVNEDLAQFYINLSGEESVRTEPMKS